MITEAIANRVWDLLVEHAGASNHDAERIAFVVGVMGEFRVPEYRFQGALGFGGKVYFRDPTQGWRVYYYPEDKSAARNRMAEDTNNALAKAFPPD